MIKGIAFDLEGPIIDVEFIHFKAFELAAKDFGIQKTKERIIAEIPNAIGGGDKMIAIGISQMGASVTADEILERKRVYYNRILDEQQVIAPRAGVLEIIRWFKSQNFPIAIASLTPVGQARVLFARSGVDQLFTPDCILLAEDVQNLKPAPDVYLKSAERMGIKPCDQLVFEDSATGVKAAVAAGSIPIGTPVHSVQKLLVEIIQSGASRIFLDWREMNIAALIANL